MMRHIVFEHSRQAPILSWYSLLTLGSPLQPVKLKAIDIPKGGSANDRRCLGPVYFVPFLPTQHAYPVRLISRSIFSLQEHRQTAEAKILETTAQLEQLQISQRQLEARNFLLEKVVHLNKQTAEACEPLLPPHEVSQSVSHIRCLLIALQLPSRSRVRASSQGQKCDSTESLPRLQGVATWETTLCRVGNPLPLTVWGKDSQLLDAEHASQLNLPEFRRLWKVRI